MAAYSTSAHKARIDSVFERAKTVDDLQLQADLARLLCILVSGFLEQGARHILGGFAIRKSHPQVAQYVERRLSSFTNANAQRLCDLVGGFDGKAEKKLVAYLAGERKDAIDSVVANRNEIAHGRNVGLTLVRMEVYTARIAETIAFIEAEFE